MTQTAPILLFDGVCNVCNASVKFVLRYERAPEMQFASLQSELGQRLAKERSFPAEIATVILIDGDRVFARSSAAVRALFRLKQPWPIVGALLWLVPKPLRDLGYRIFAANRYRIFGKRDECLIPTPELRARFLDA